MHFLRLPIFLALLLTACSGGKKAVDPATLQTPAAEAVLRHVIAHCPFEGEAELAVICIGEYLATPTPKFMEKFRDVPGLEVIPHTRVVAGMAGGKSRRYDEKTDKPVLELQIGDLTAAKDGVQQATAAWAFKDDAARRQYEVRAKEGGGFEVKALGEIAIPARNDDRRSAQ